MATLVRFETKAMPDLLVIGKEIRYSMEEQMQGNNRIPGLWDACFAGNAFAPLEAQADFVYDDAYVGVMIDWDKGDGDFSYICGMLMKPGADTPEGYSARALPAGMAAIAWIYGKDVGDVCSSAHQMTEQKLRAEGMTNAKMRWCMELYNCPRFTTPDADGNIILDYWIPVD